MQLVGILGKFKWIRREIKEIKLYQVELSQIESTSLESVWSGPRDNQNNHLIYLPPPYINSEY